MVKCAPAASNQPPTAANFNTPAKCVQDCSSVRTRCIKAAGKNSVALHQCNGAGQTCTSRCKSVTPPAASSSANGASAYQAAVLAARQRYLDGQKKLLDQYQADLESAWRNYGVSN